MTRSRAIAPPATGAPAVFGHRSSSLPARRGSRFRTEREPRPCRASMPYIPGQFWLFAARRGGRRRGRVRARRLRRGTRRRRRLRRLGRGRRVRDRGAASDQRAREGEGHQGLGDVVPHVRSPPFPSVRVEAQSTGRGWETGGSRPRGAGAFGPLPGRAFGVRSAATWTSMSTIVGGGSAGCVLAARLSEDPGRRVLLLEAGPDYPRRGDLPPDIADGSGPPWQPRLGLRVPSPTPARRTARPSRGPELIGGCSSTNGASGAARAGPPTTTRGPPPATPGWSFDDVLPVFRAVETDPTSRRLARRRRPGPGLTGPSSSPSSASTAAFLRPPRLPATRRSPTTTGPAPWGSGRCPATCVDGTPDEHRPDLPGARPAPSEPRDPPRHPRRPCPARPATGPPESAAHRRTGGSRRGGPRRRRVRAARRSCCAAASGRPST